MHDFSPQGLTGTEFARAGHASPALFDANAELAKCHLKNYNPQEPTDTILAFATAGHTSAAFFDAVAEVAKSRLRDFSAQELASTVRAIAKAGHGSPAFFDAIAEVAKSCLKDFDLPELAKMVAHMLWVFATAGHESLALCDATTEVVKYCFTDFNPKAFAGTLWALVSSKNVSPAVFDAVAKPARSLSKEFHPEELAKTVWAFATCKQESTALFDAIAEVARCHSKQFNLQVSLSQCSAGVLSQHSEAEKDAVTNEIQQECLDSASDAKAPISEADVPQAVTKLHILGGELGQEGQQFPGSLVKMYLGGQNMPYDPLSCLACGDSYNEHDIEFRNTYSCSKCSIELVVKHDVHCSTSLLKLRPPVEEKQCKIADGHGKRERQIEARPSQDTTNRTEIHSGETVLKFQETYSNFSSQEKANCLAEFRVENSHDAMDVSIPEESIIIVGENGRLFRKSKAYAIMSASNESKEFSWKQLPVKNTFIEWSNEVSSHPGLLRRAQSWPSFFPLLEGLKPEHAGDVGYLSAKEELLITQGEKADARKVKEQGGHKGTGCSQELTGSSMSFSTGATMLEYSIWPAEASFACMVCELSDRQFKLFATKPNQQAKVVEQNLSADLFNKLISEDQFELIHVNGLPGALGDHVGGDSKAVQAFMYTCFSTRKHCSFGGCAKEMARRCESKYDEECGFCHHPVCVKVLKARGAAPNARKRKRLKKLAANGNLEPEAELAQIECAQELGQQTDAEEQACREHRISDARVACQQCTVVLESQGDSEKQACQGEDTLMVTKQVSPDTEDAHKEVLTIHGIFAASSNRMCFCETLLQSLEPLSIHQNDAAVATLCDASRFPIIKFLDGLSIAFYAKSDSKESMQTLPQVETRDR